jgi:hypothetical protein
MIKIAAANSAKHTQTHFFLGSSSCTFSKSEIEGFSKCKLVRQVRQDKVMI